MGENWLIREAGSYFPSVDEEIVEVKKAHILTEKKAIRIKALHSFTDAYGEERNAGKNWLVTLEQSDTHIIDVHEEFVSEVPLTVLSNR